MSSRIRAGRYRHYKGKLYDVIGVAMHSENPKEKFVVYRALYDSKEFGKKALWIRPERMFTEKVTLDGKRVPRFKRIR
jgi:hypothetical protein